MFEPGYPISVLVALDFPLLIKRLFFVLISLGSFHPLGPKRLTSLVVGQYDIKYVILKKMLILLRKLNIKIHVTLLKN